MVLPFPNGTTGAISTKNLSGWGSNMSSTYGNRIHPITGKKTFHQGDDIPQKKGTPLQSNVSGTVTFAGDKGSSYGNYVTIKDSSGKTHYYAHLDKVSVKAGQKVTAGMLLGAIGSTGRSTGPHLHYEVRDANNKHMKPVYV